MYVMSLNVYTVAFEINCKYHPDPTVSLASAHQTVQKRILGTHRHIVQFAGLRAESRDPSTAEHPALA